jgi:hypothetical protein
MLVTIVNGIVIQVSETNVWASLWYDYPVLILFQCFTESLATTKGREIVSTVTA